MPKVIELNSEDETLQYLCCKDRRFANVVDMEGDITYQPHDDGYAFWVQEIIEQMLSIKAELRYMDD